MHVYINACIRTLYLSVLYLCSFIGSVMVQANRTFAAVDTIRTITEQLINCSTYLNQSITELGPQLREVKNILVIATIHLLSYAHHLEVVLFGCCQPDCRRIHL